MSVKSPNASSDLQEAVEGILAMQGVLRARVPIISRRTHELENDIDAAAAMSEGVCIYVLPPNPLSALQDVPFVFFDKFELRVRIIEIPALNSSGADCYALRDDVCNGLHWQPTNAVNARIAALIAADDTLSVETAGALVQTDPTYAGLVKLAGMLAYPLQLAPRPVEDGGGEISEDSVLKGKFIRVIDVIFNAVLGLVAPAN